MVAHIDHGVCRRTAPAAQEVDLGRKWGSIPQLWGSCEMFAQFWLGKILYSSRTTTVYVTLSMHAYRVKASDQHPGYARTRARAHEIELLPQSVMAATYAAALVCVALCNYKTTTVYFFENENDARKVTYAQQWKQILIQSCNSHWTWFPRICDSVIYRSVNRHLQIGATCRVIAEKLLKNHQIVSELGCPNLSVYGNFFRPGIRSTWFLENQVNPFIGPQKFKTWVRTRNKKTL